MIHAVHPSLASIAAVVVVAIWGQLRVLAEFKTWRIELPSQIRGPNVQEKSEKVTADALTEFGHGW
jgi:hypothetical protein